MQYRTDLACEACEGLENISGVECKTFESNGVKVDDITISSDSAAERIGKRKGRYITVECNAVGNRDINEYADISKAIAEQLRSLTGVVGEKATVLVVGLGNRRMTPDSLGPRTTDKLFVTRHIFEYLPQSIDERLRPVCAFAPGVLGVTGLESADVVLSVCSRIPLSLVIVIDALAARRSERIFSTVQLSDSGIEPGSGVGNKRSGLNRETLGVPVIAIGIPMVVYASTLVSDAVEELTDEAQRNAETATRQKLGDMVVTPKEIDVIAEDSSKILADALNLALHKNISLEEIREYMF